MAQELAIGARLRAGGKPLRQCRRPPRRLHPAAGTGVWMAARKDFSGNDHLCNGRHILRSARRSDGGPLGRPGHRPDRRCPGWSGLRAVQHRKRIVRPMVGPLGRLRPGIAGDTHAGLVCGCIQQVRSKPRLGHRRDGCRRVARIDDLACRRRVSDLEDWLAACICHDGNRMGRHRGNCLLLPPHDNEEQREIRRAQDARRRGHIRRDVCEGSDLILAFRAYGRSGPVVRSGLYRN